MEPHILGLGTHKTMVSFAFIVGFFGAGPWCASSQDLAPLLGSQNEDIRQEAIRSVLTAGQPPIPLLLSWTKHAPHNLNGYQGMRLYASLAQLFGELRVKEAVPFLLQNLDVNGAPEVSGGAVWQKAPAVIEARLPAVGALIRIGSAAVEAIVHSPDEARTFYDRLARVFIISVAIGTVVDPLLRSDAEFYLNVALGEADIQRRLADEGLKHFSRTVR